MTNGLLDARTLNIMRTALYGAGASLTFYTMTPAAGETEVFTTTRGWYAQRAKEKESDASGAVKIWMASDVTEWPLDEHLHSGGKITITAGGRVQAYRITEVKSMQQLGSGWVLRCDPAENSTEPANG